MPSVSSNRLPNDKDGVIYPQVSIGLLHELGSRTEHRSWRWIDEKLELGEDGHKAVRGLKRDRRNGYPSRFSKDTYLDALDDLALCYEHAMDPIKITKSYLDDQNVRIGAIDAVFDDIAATEFARWDDKTDGWWEAIKTAIYCSFAYDNRERRTKPASGRTAERPRTASADDRANENADVRPPTVLRLLKACLFDESVGESRWVDALRVPGGAQPEPPACASRAVVFGKPLDDAEFVERLFPRGFAAFAEGGLGLDATALVDAPPSGGVAMETFEYFSCDGGLRFGHLVERCRPFAARADGAAFFGDMDFLLEALERRSERPGDIRSTRSAFLRYADGSVARGLAFVLAGSLLGLDNPRILAQVVEQPEARKR